MNYRSLTLSCLILGYLAACTPEKDKQSSSADTEPGKVKKYEHEVLSEKSGAGIKITNIGFDTSAIDRDTRGVIVTFNLEVTRQAFDSSVLNGYNAYFVDLTCLPGDGKTFVHRKEVFKAADKKKFMHRDKEFFISSPANRSLEITIPYRVLEMKEGSHELTLNIEAFPAKFVNDSSSLHVKILNNISPEASASLSVKIKVNAPKLYKASFTVHRFKLNTKVVKPEKYDFAVGGSGLPDLFWEVYCGNDYLYYSPVAKNKTEYKKKYSSPVFYCTKDDVINLAVVDYDNGPFNTQDDVIEKWNGKISSFPSGKIDTLQFGNLEYFVFETKVE